MEISGENIMLIGSLLLLISIFAGKTSFRFGIPVLLLFLAIGMLAGSDGLGGIRFENPRIAQFVGIVSLNFILFSGGLDTNWKAIKPVLWIGVSLSTLGVLLTATTLGFFIHVLTDFTLIESLLLGTIVSSTDAAAVFSILRAKNLGLKKNLRPTLELESGSNDPMAYVLTIAFLGLIIEPEKSAWSIIPMFLQQMSLGLIAGFGFGFLSKQIINKIKLDFEGLYPVLVIALMFLNFSVTDFFGGNGFLSIYISAVYLGNNPMIHKKTIFKVFDGFAWLMQIVLFLTLGLLVFPSDIVPVFGIGILISLFLIFVARPLAVFISLIPFKMKLRRRFYISWVGLRGAVPIVFATYPLIAGIDKANTMFHIVFFISVTSVIIQGSTLSIVAKWLHVAIPEKAKPLNQVEKLLADREKQFKETFKITPNCAAIGKKMVELAIPTSVNIIMIERNKRYLSPNGATIVESGDILHVLADDELSLLLVQEGLRIDKVAE